MKKIIKLGDKKIMFKFNCKKCNTEFESNEYKEKVEHIGIEDLDLFLYHISDICPNCRNIVLIKKYYRNKKKYNIAIQALEKYKYELEEKVSYPSFDLILLKIRDYYGFKK